jgi:hypothetical protein
MDEDAPASPTFSRLSVFDPSTSTPRGEIHLQHPLGLSVPGDFTDR